MQRGNKKDQHMRATNVGKLEQYHMKGKYRCFEWLQTGMAIAIEDKGARVVEDY